MGSYPGPCANQGLFSPLLLAATLAPGLMPPNACRGCPHFQIDGTSGVPAACLLPGHKGGGSARGSLPHAEASRRSWPFGGHAGRGLFPIPPDGAEPQQTTSTPRHGWGVLQPFGSCDRFLDNC